MAHVVTCQYCQARFDRDKEEYVLVSARRYGHASCMLRALDKDPSAKRLEIIDPNDTVTCAYCNKQMSKKDEDCVMIGNNRYVHAACKDLEEHREKTDKEKLEDYIKQLFDTTYVNPRVQKQIKQYVEEYNYTYSGIQKALYYFYELKNGDLSKANGGIGIVPHIYQKARDYYFDLWQAQQRNQNINIELYTPKVREITIPRPSCKAKKRPLFTFLDEQEAN